MNNSTRGDQKSIIDLQNKITKLEKIFIGLDESAVKLGPDDDQFNTELDKVLGDLNATTIENINENRFSTHEMNLIVELLDNKNIIHKLSIENISKIKEYRPKIEKVADILKKKGVKSGNIPEMFKTPTITPLNLNEEKVKQNQEGEGDEYSEGLGTSNTQLNKIMEPFRRKINYLGAIPKDFISGVQHNNNDIENWSFIYNTDDSTKTGKHWKAVYFDGASLEYYDPLDKEIEKDVYSCVTTFIAENYNYFVTFKDNKVKQQLDSSDKCGMFSVRFLIGRTLGIHFKILTGFSNKH